MIDCENRTHLCHAACCILGGERVPVKQADQRCPHLTDDLKCGIYEDRPEACQYDCRRNCTIWIDFERKVPNPDLGRHIKCRVAAESER